MSAFEELRESADATITKLRALALKAGAADKEALRALNSEMTRLIKEVDRNIKGMENEARAAGPSQRRVLNDAISDVKGELNAVRQTIQKANANADRGELLSGQAERARAELDARDRMVNSTETAVRSTAKLQQAQSLLAETQDVGISVIDNMQQQRETIVRTTQKTEDISGLTKTARGVIKGIQRRAVTNKFLLGGAIGLLVACIGIVVWYGYFFQPKDKK